MTERYTKEIEALKKWFIENLSAFPPLTLTRDEYSAGTDSLKDGYKAIVGFAFWKWLYEHNYELAYNQGCNAFFQAVKELGKLTIVD